MREAIFDKKQVYHSSKISINNAKNSYGINSAYDEDNHDTKNKYIVAIIMMITRTLFTYYKPCEQKLQYGKLTKTKCFSRKLYMQYVDVRNPFLGKYFECPFLSDVCCEAIRFHVISLLFNEFYQMQLKKCFQTRKPTLKLSIPVRSSPQLKINLLFINRVN